MQSHSQLRDAVLSSHDATELDARQDRHYSDSDIAILHAIVAAAQTYIDESAYPKPLPLTALFKAYYALLPGFDISPDSDYHLSPLLFRIGGIESHDALFDKFQVVLDDLGILLDITSESAHHSPSSRLSPVAESLVDYQSRQGQSHNNDDTVSVNDEPSASDLSLSIKSARAPHHVITTFQPPQQQQQQLRHQPRWSSPSTDGFVPSVSSDHSEHISVAAHRHASRPFALATDFRSTFSRTGQQNALVPLQGRKLQAAPSLSLEPQHEGASHSLYQRSHGANTHYYHHGDDIVYMNPEPANLPPDLLEKASSQDQVPLNHRAQQHLQVPSQDAGKHDSKTMAQPSVRQKAKDQEPKTNTAPPSASASSLSENLVLLQRAARARQLYLGSKMFNRWADRTAIRLEKEAVATRHMMRFRCFHGWTLASVSRTPAVDSLRASTAVQKLRRAVKLQQEQFSLTASVVAQALYSKRAHCAMMRWMCRLSQHRLRRKFDKSRALSLVDRWKLLARQDDTTQQKALAYSTRLEPYQAMSQWRILAHQADTSLTMASQIETARRCMAHLGWWVFRVEVQRRSNGFRKCLLLQAASQAFYEWNLRARAQAFRWTCEYAAVSRAVNVWTQMAGQDVLTNKLASSQYQRASKERAWKQMRHINETWTQLGCLDERARLYLSAMRVLDVLDDGVKKRKSRMKKMIRQYLMTRYTQSSSRRRRRNCYKALDRWSAASWRALEQLQAAKDMRAADKSQHLQAALADMDETVALQERLRKTAQQHRIKALVDLWASEAANDAQDSVQSWDVWMSAERRHCLKTWSIGTLQRSGQGHTAVMVQQRHDRETRGRVMQWWRRRHVAGPGNWASDGRRGDTGPRSLPPRLSRHSMMGPMETPTRWTGSALPMTHLLTSTSRRIMGPVDETDETEGSETPIQWPSTTTPMSSQSGRLGRSATTFAATRQRLDSQRLNPQGQRSVPARIAERRPLGGSFSSKGRSRG
ncbi:hypothetical protein CDD82_5769 [Ophiocordyceps australis]|uniref:Sfi1 spindle body domain-containing protein n=1 Tax=Ophiocordyceps australis TaxID=1399860 RepID=A0A2C5Z131_9HYPO|nr:hypothetical protein CDD82_5769 [Ophiocordyceps australis]